MNGIVKVLRGNLDVNALIESGDVERMKKVLQAKRAILTSSEKADLIYEIGDPEFIKRCVEDLSFNLDKYDLAWLIGRTKDAKYIEKHALRAPFKKDSHNKSYLLRMTGNPEIIKKYLNDKHITSKDKAELILMAFEDEQELMDIIEHNKFGLDSTGIRTILEKKCHSEFVISCIKNNKIGLDTHDKGILIDYALYGYYKDQVKDMIFNVDSISKISLAQLEALPDDEIIRIRSAKKEEKYDYYSKSEFVAIKKVADKILEGIEQPKKGDEASELATFKKIYGRLAKHMTYDHAAIKKKNKNDEKWQRDCRNLMGLASGKTVCAGYSCILVQLLEEMGMEAKYIRGDDGETGHAWTQVKIGEKWFNTDLTWERDMVALKRGRVSTRVLKSDRQFKDHKKYSERRTPTEEKCITPIIGMAMPKIAPYSDEYGIRGSVQRLAQKFSLGISEMQVSYGSILRQVHTRENVRSQETTKVLDNGGEIGE